MWPHMKSFLPGTCHVMVVVFSLSAVCSRIVGMQLVPLSFVVSLSGGRVHGLKIPHPLSAVLAWDTEVILFSLLELSSCLSSGDKVKDPWGNCAPIRYLTWSSMIPNQNLSTSFKFKWQVRTLSSVTALYLDPTISTCWSSGTKISASVSL